MQYMECDPYTCIYVGLRLVHKEKNLHAEIICAAASGRLEQSKTYWQAAGESRWSDSDHKEDPGFAAAQAFDPDHTCAG